MKLSNETLAQLCVEHNYHVPDIAAAVRELIPGFDARPARITARINRLREKGMLPLDSGNYVSSGEVLKGSSTLYDENGDVKLQWVKTDVEKQSMLDHFQQLVDNVAESLPKFEKTEYSVTHASEDLMAIYPLGDAHIGMKAYRDEAGDDWDLHDAQQVFCGVFDRLVKTAPHCERAVIVNLGDYFHRDNKAGKTERSGHMLDSDGTYQMMADTGLKIIIQMINSALEHHQTVEVINAIGNHDDTGSMFLQVALKHMYQNEPRVIVHCNSGAFQYFTHGDNLYGVHHGHECKGDKLPLVMATDQAEAWGQAKFRSWLTGHVHHDSVKEHSGCTVETFRTLANKDAYAYSHGWRSGQDSKALVVHAKYGEVERHTINIAQVFDR